MNKEEYIVTRKTEMEKIKVLAEKHGVPFEESLEKMLRRYLSNCSSCIRRYDMEQAKIYYNRAYAINPNDRAVMFVKDNFYSRTYPVSFSEREYCLEGIILGRQEINN